MSDALLELMEPYFSWPPARDELEDVMDWLQLGADIWNITVEASDAEACSRRLAHLATELVEEIARRKFARFGYDRRRVASVWVVERVWQDVGVRTDAPKPELLAVLVSTMSTFPQCGDARKSRVRCRTASTARGRRPGVKSLRIACCGDRPTRPLDGDNSAHSSVFGAVKALGGNSFVVTPAAIGG